MGLGSQPRRKLRSGNVTVLSEVRSQGSAFSETLKRSRHLAENSSYAWLALGACDGDCVSTRSRHGVTLIELVVVLAIISPQEPNPPWAPWNRGLARREPRQGRGAFGGRRVPARPQRVDSNGQCPSRPPAGRTRRHRTDRDLERRNRSQRQLPGRRWRNRSPDRGRRGSRLGHHGFARERNARTERPRTRDRKRKRRFHLHRCEPRPRAPPQRG